MPHRGIGKGLWTTGCLVLAAFAGCSGGSGDEVTELNEAAVKPSCGDGRCRGKESCATCPSDCGICGGSGGASTSATSSSSATTTSSSSATSTGSGGAGGLAASYPGDVGIANDPAVVFAENFEEGSVSLVVGRYEDYKNPAGMALVSNVPAASSGSASMRMTAGGSQPAATDLYKRFSANYDELYVRYYARYEANAPYHHTGVWFGGYNPPLNWPSPHAGEKPNGDDRFSISFEPIGGPPNPRMDFYNYWMTMHSGPNAYWGNTLIHEQGVRATDDQWMCIEVHARLNPDPSSPAGALLALRVNEAPIITFDDQAPLGYWLWDKFCPEGADGPECTNYPPAPATPMIPLDLQFRNTASLGLNYIWPQNYNTASTASSVSYDDMVVATVPIGCIQ